MGKGLEELSEQDIEDFRREFKRNIKITTEKIDKINDKFGEINKDLRIVDKLIKYKILSGFKDYVRRYFH